MADFASRFLTTRPLGRGKGFANAGVVIGGSSEALVAPVGHFAWSEKVLSVFIFMPETSVFIFTVPPTCTSAPRPVSN